MRFWDSSALVPLVVEERTSKACRQLLRTDPRLIVWLLTRTEVISALWRRHRAGDFDESALQTAESRLDKLSRQWTEVDATIPVREAAERVLRLHPLRAADTMQLASALVVFEGRPRGREFVTLDDALASAASREGFRVVVPR